MIKEALGPRAFEKCECIVGLFYHKHWWSCEGPRTFENTDFWNGARWAKGKEFFNPDMCLTLRSLVSNLVPIYKQSSNYVFSTPIRNKGSKSYITVILDQSWKRTFIQNWKRDQPREIKLSKVRHASRPKFLYLDNLMFMLKLEFFNVCALLLRLGYVHSCGFCNEP